MTCPKSFFLCLLFFASLLFAPRLHAADSDNMFPEYDCIQDNVAFWTRIYSKFPSTEGVVHDKDDLKLIYGVVDLLPESAPGSDKINQNRMEAAKGKYRAILQKLAAGKTAGNEEEKKIASLFGPNPLKSRLTDAGDNLRVQRGQKDHFLKGLVRSGRYIEEIKKIFQEKGLPTDLAYLPHVESSFNYEAYSKFGAAGIWQFTRSTGKRYLDIDYALDERRDPIASSRAAACYLKENFDLLGNWPMAITAYNHGEAGMLRAKEQLKTYERIFLEYEKGYFKFASRNFYSEYLAARKIAKNYRQYFGDVTLEKPLAAVTITLPGYLACEDALHHYCLDAKTLRTLNPALRPPIFDGQKYIPKGYALRLPAAGVKTAEVMPAEAFRKEQKRSEFYKVQPGDTAGLIARRQGVKLRDLVLANNLDRKATILVGQSLHLPGVSKEAAAGPIKAAKEKTAKDVVVLAEAAAKNKPADEEAAAASWAASPEVDLSNAEVNHLAIEKTVLKDNRLFGVIRVAPEETIGHYAEWLNVPAGEILAANHKKSARSINTDQELYVPLTKVSARDFEEKRLDFHREIEEDFFAAYQVENLVSYRVKKGDTIWSICYEKLDLPVWLLKKYNTQIDFSRLYPSQTLKVPQVSSQS